LGGTATTTRLQTFVAALAALYPQGEAPSEPLALILWENVGYLIDDERRVVPSSPSGSAFRRRPSTGRTARCCSISPGSPALSRRTIAPRLRGVVRAFLCRFIRSPETQLMCRNNSLPGPDRMDNLLGPHS